MQPSGYRTRSDGTVYPIYERKGRGGLVAAGVGIVLAVSAGGTGTAVVGGSAGSSVGLSAAESAAVRSIRTNLPKAKNAARKGKPAKAWRKLGLRRGRTQSKDTAACWVFSFGQVQEFFAQRPCRNLSRVQFPVIDDQGNTISVLVSRVRMPRMGDAYRFQRLIDEHGTGDIRPVLPDVPFTGHHYDSRVRGRTVIVAEAEPRDGTAPDAELDAVAAAAVALAPR